MNKCIYSEAKTFSLIRVDSNTIFYEKMYPIGGTVILPFLLEKEKKDSLIFKINNQNKNIAYAKKVVNGGNEEMNLTILDLELNDTFLINYLFINNELYRTNKKGVFNIPRDSLPLSIQDSFIVKFHTLGEFKLQLEYDPNSDYIIYAHNNIPTENWISEISLYKNKYYVNGELLKGKKCGNKNRIYNLLIKE